MSDRLQQARTAIEQADAILLSAGAGMGVDSGLPDFRGNEGFWRAYPPMAKLGIGFAEMANPHWFDQRPQLAWGFYGHRLNLYRHTQPHAGFSHLRQLAESRPGGYFIFTSNVDGQFQKAGFAEEAIVECHGSIHHIQCTLPCTDTIHSADALELSVGEESFLAEHPLPICPTCHRLARPNILMFGDGGWLTQRTQAQEQRLQQWLDSKQQAGEKVAIIEMGAGLAVPTVRYFSESVSKALSAALIRINPRDAHVPGGAHQFSLEMGALEGITKLLEL
uniref:protein acetyllysine N-acetyltransferase n=1 Tax=Magnetococcus massalia (strain MO-1) TaxID=451514 RepID=A0A1S7LEI7_MAGMO|nr:putative Sir2 family Transcriptional regulator [Candidatus Magnetococcus massalia]